MGIAKNLKEEFLGISILVIIIVVFSLLFVKMRATVSIVCPSGYDYYNNSAGVCCDAAGSCGTNTSALGTQSTIDTFTTAFAEPKNWIIIIVIGIIAVGLIRLFMKMNNKTE